MVAAATASSPISDSAFLSSFSFSFMAAFLAAISWSLLMLAIEESTVTACTRVGVTTADRSANRPSAARAVIFLGVIVSSGSGDSME